jgi:hypothetical protein
MRMTELAHSRIHEEVIDSGNRLRPLVAQMPESMANNVIFLPSDSSSEAAVVSGRIIPVTDDDRTHVMLLDKKNGGLDRVLVIGAYQVPGVPDQPIIDEGASLDAPVGIYWSHIGLDDAGVFISPLEIPAVRVTGLAAMILWVY